MMQQPAMDGSAARIENVSGTVLAVSPDGSTRVVKNGDMLLPEEVLQTSDGSSATVVLPNGNTVYLSANTMYSMPQAGASLIPDVVSTSDDASSDSSQFYTGGLLHGLYEGVVNPDVNLAKSPHASFPATPANELASTSLEASGDIDSGEGSSAPAAGLSTMTVVNADSSLLGPVGYSPLQGLTGQQGAGFSATVIGSQTSSVPIVSPPSTFSPSATATATSFQSVTQESSETSSSTATSASVSPSESTSVSPSESATTFTSTPVALATNADSSSVLIGQTLNQQTGVLSNDTGTDVSVTSVNGTVISNTGTTTVQGDYGVLTIQANGSYSYDATTIDLYSDLAAHWDFNGATSPSTAADQSRMDSISDTGTLNNNASIVTGGVSGNALSLDGTGDFMSVDNSVEINVPTDGTVEARTVSLSFRPASSSSMTDRQVLYEEGGSTTGFIIYIHNDTLYAGAYDGTDWTGQFFSTSLASLNTSEWHNVTLSLNGTAGTMNAWLDGSSFGQTTTAQTLDAHTGDIRVGGSSSSNRFHDGTQTGSFNFEGMIDDVRVYNRALNAHEAQVLNDGTTGLSETFTYSAQDSSGSTSSSALTINVQQPSNFAPVAENDTLSVMAGQAVTVNSTAGQGVLGNDGDPDGNTLIVTNVGTTAVSSSGTTTITGQYGTLIIAANGTYSYAPLNSATAGGSDSFTYTVSDGTTTSTANLIVTVVPDGFASADSITLQESSLPDNAIYMIDRDDNSSFLSVVDTDTGVTHRLGQLTGASGSTSSSVIGMSPTGVLYGTDGTNLYTIDPATQAMTAIGAHGVSTSGGITGMTVAPDGTIYASSYDGHIYTLNPTTGAATDLGAVTGFEYNFGDIVWHDGGLYTLAYTYANSQNTYQIVRIDPTSSGGITVTPTPNTFDGSSLHSMMSLNGELMGVVYSSISSSVLTIDTTTGLVSERGAITGMVEPEDAAAASGQNMAGNVLTNDTGGQSVTTIALPDGDSSTVGNSGATIQGMYGSLTINADGSYVYSLDNNLEATNNLASGETGNDRFVYTASNSSGDTSQSILTVYVNGTSEVQVADQAIFTDYTAIDSVSTTSTTVPIDFTVDTQNSTDKITEIRISNTTDSTFNVPSILSDNGTISTANSEFVWTATPGTNAGLDSFDAITAGLTLASINNDHSYGQLMTISATVSEYDSSGVATSSWTSTSSVSISLVGIDHTRTGTSGNDTLTGSSTIHEMNDEFIGGAGNDTMTGGSGTDFFVWQSADVGTSSAPAVDTITDFTASVSGDVLDLRDLLPDNASSTLDEFLNFSFSNGDTTIGVSTTAGGPVVQNIVLDGVDLSSSMGTSDVTQLVNQLTDNGNLLV